MKTSIESTEKKVYSSPQIERILLDNEISLVLSSPESLPDWSENKENFNKDPFKTNVG